MMTGLHLTDGATMPPASPSLPIARNTALLSAATRPCSSSMPGRDRHPTRRGRPAAS
jgi:hypothetical protein